LLWKARYGFGSALHPHSDSSLGPDLRLDIGLDPDPNLLELSADPEDGGGQHMYRT
jgi:hypothetical protein